MSFFNSQHQTLPKRGQNKFPLRSRRYKRLQLLQDFEPGRVYSFAPIDELDELPEGTTLWEIDDFDEVLSYAQ